MKAFPNATSNLGMDLRDYFAAKAMHAFLVSDGKMHYEKIAIESYYIADEMMKAKETK